MKSRCDVANHTKRAASAPCTLRIRPITSLNTVRQQYPSFAKLVRIRGWIGEYARKQRLVGIQPSNDQKRAHRISTAFPCQSVSGREQAKTNVTTHRCR